MQYRGGRAGTRLVGMKQPNAWALYDMLGNVLEWCADGMRDYSERGEKDPTGAASEARSRAVRGGSWIDYARFVRSAFRLAARRGLPRATLVFVVPEFKRSLSQRRRPVSRRRERAGTAAQSGRAGGLRTAALRRGM